MASVPITVLLYSGPLLSGFNVPVKGLNSIDAMTSIQQLVHICPYCLSPDDITSASDLILEIILNLYTRCSHHFLKLIKAANNWKLKKKQFNILKLERHEH